MSDRNEPTVSSAAQYAQRMRPEHDRHSLASNRPFRRLKIALRYHTLLDTKAPASPSSTCRPSCCCLTGLV
jgi:hypothetical protein